MTIKKASSNAKKMNKVAGKRHAKITVRKGEKVSSMKVSTGDFHFTHPIDKGSPKLF